MFEHLKGTNYKDHLSFSLFNTFYLVKYSIQSIIHGLYPPYYDSCIRDVISLMKGRLDAFDKMKVKDS
jgi:hypothetical protein